MAAFKLRWQNDQGDPVAEEFVSYFADRNGEIRADPATMNEILTAPLSPMPVSQEPPEDRRNRFDLIAAKADQQLARESSRFKHPNGIVQLAAADCRTA